MRTIRPLLLILLLVMPMAVHAQEEALPLAVTYEDKLYVMQTVPNSPPQLLESLTLVSDTPTYNYLASWSPDGTMLAYATSTSGDVPNTLMVWDGEQSIEVLSARFGVEIPFGWTDDGQIVYMQVSGDIGNFLGQVYTVAPEAGAQPTLVAENLPADVMCSIGMLVPMNTQLWREADVLEVAPFLAVTEAGILYGKGCSGSSVSLYRFETGEVISFAEDRLVRAALSPDGSQLAGIDLRSGTLIVVDLASLTETAIPTSEPITRVVWGDDGSLYYTSVTQTGNLVGGLTEEQRQQVLTISQQQNPVTSPFFQSNTVRLYRRAADGTETLLFENEAYGVGRLAMRNNTVVFSTVANGEAWVQAILDGSLTADDVFFDAALSYIPVSVRYVTLNAEGGMGSAGVFPGDLERFAMPR